MSQKRSHKRQKCCCKKNEKTLSREIKAIGAMNITPALTEQEIFEVEKSFESFSVTRRICLAILKSEKNQLKKLLQENALPIEEAFSLIDSWLDALKMQKEVAKIAEARLMVAACATCL